MEIEKKNLDNGAEVSGIRENNKGLKNERHKWVASLEYILEYILKNEESEQAASPVEELVGRLRESGLKIPYAVNTPYINTIPLKKNLLILATAKSSDASRATCAGMRWPWLSKRTGFILTSGAIFRPMRPRRLSTKSASTISSGVATRTV